MLEASQFNDTIEILCENEEEEISSAPSTKKGRETILSYLRMIFRPRAKKVGRSSDSENSDSYVHGLGFNWKSLKKLILCIGPGAILSHGYTDPGNIQSDMQTGTVVGYQLLWVLLFSTAIGVLLQCLAVRLTVVTGRHLSQICYEEYGKLTRILLWLVVEISVIASDIQSVIGTAMAIYLLSNGRIPLWGGVIITCIDAFIVLFLELFGLRVLEGVFGLMLGVMTKSFGYEYVKSKPDQADVFKGIFAPMCKGCNDYQWMMAVATIGAVLMPYNIYLHSGLISKKTIKRETKGHLDEAKILYCVEAGIALLMAFIINLFVVCIFASGLYGKTYEEFYSICENSNNSRYHNISNGDLNGNQTITKTNFVEGGVYLACQYGDATMYIWAISIFIAGQSSTMSKMFASQFVLEGFFDLKWKRWQTALFSRTFAIIPCIGVAFAVSDTTCPNILNDNMKLFSTFNDSLNYTMALMLPSALIPLLTFTCDKRIMGEYVNSTRLSICLFISVTCLGIGYSMHICYLFSSKFNSRSAVIVVVGIGYGMFHIYLTILMVVRWYKTCETRDDTVTLSD